MKLYYDNGFRNAGDENYCDVCGELLIDFVHRTYFDRDTGEKVEMLGKKCGKPWYKKLGRHYIFPDVLQFF